MPGDVNLSADVVQEVGGRWAASVSRHPGDGGPGSVVWHRQAMRSEHNAEVAMEAAWRRALQGETK